MTPAAYPRVLSSRASSPLLFGLAPRGVFRAPGVATGAVGSYPTFSPLPGSACIAKTSCRFPCRMPPCSLHRRSILCGTFRDAVVAPGFSPALSTSSPDVIRRVALSRVPPTIPRTPFGLRKRIDVTQDGVRTFLPSSVGSWPRERPASTGTSDHPARPPVFIIARSTPAQDADSEVAAVRVAAGIRSAGSGK